jgi:hydroxyacylglutathione hydrolase
MPTTSAACGTSCDLGAVPVVGPDDDRIALRTRTVRDGERCDLPDLGLSFETLAVPGHTLSHIAFWGHGALFCGDTLFSAGCGRMFEGTATQMNASLTRLRDLPPETRMFCGHEYTAANLRFALTVDPDNSIASRVPGTGGAHSRRRRCPEPALAAVAGDSHQSIFALRHRRHSSRRRSSRRQAATAGLGCFRRPARLERPVPMRRSVLRTVANRRCGSVGGRLRPYDPQSPVAPAVPVTPTPADTTPEPLVKPATGALPRSPCRANGSITTARTTTICSTACEPASPSTKCKSRPSISSSPGSNTIQIIWSGYFSAASATCTTSSPRSKRAACPRSSLCCRWSRAPTSPSPIRPAAPRDCGNSFRARAYASV